MGSLYLNLIHVADSKASAYFTASYVMMILRRVHLYNCYMMYGDIFYEFYQM